MPADFDYLAELDGTPAEQAWIKERLETLSVRESYALAAATMRYLPEDTGGAARCLCALDDYDMRFPAGSYEELGELYLHQGNFPKNALPYVDLERLGQVYEDEHPGMFVGQCYVEYPPRSSPGEPPPPLRDDGWSVKLKLASPACPEGVWLRLPARDGKMVTESDEVVLALDELRANSLKECALLDARCILPEAGNLMEQYSSVTELVRDGDDLGVILDEQGQGEARWMEKFSAALEHEDCGTLKFALDIAQNLHCYEWIPRNELAASAEGLLLDAKVPESIIRSGAIDLAGYRAYLLEDTGFAKSPNGGGYIARNGRDFHYEYSAPPEEGMTMR